MTRTTFPLLGIALLVSAIARATTLGAADAQARDTELQQHASHTGSYPATLVEQVRKATESFRQTIPAEYEQSPRVRRLRNEQALSPESTWTLCDSSNADTARQRRAHAGLRGLSRRVALVAE